MDDEKKSKEQLIKELNELRQQVSELQKLATKNELSNELHHMLVEIIENMPNGLTVQDLNHQIIYANSAIEKKTGYSRVELYDIHPSIFSFNEGSVAITQDIMDSISLYSNWCGELYIKCKDGSAFLSEVEVFPIIKDGTPIALVSIQHDITKRKEMENQLKAERKRLFTLLDGIPAFVSLRAPNHTIPYANQYYKEHFGDPGMSPCYSFQHNCTERCEECKAFRVFETNNPETWEATGYNGKTYQYFAYPFSDTDNSSLVLIFGFDTTKHKLAEKRLQAAHQQLIDIIEFLPDATFVIDSDRKVIAWNRALEEMVGIKKEQVIGKGDNVYSIPFYGQRMPILIDCVFGYHSIVTEQKYDFIERKGNKIFVEAFVPAMYSGKGAHVCGSASPLFDRSGNIVGAIEIIHDITERKQAEASLRLSEERFYKVFNNSPLAMSILSYPDNKFLYVNDSAENFSGYKREECIGRSELDLNLWLNPEDEAKKRQLFEEQGFVRNLEIKIQMKSGEIRIGLLTAEFINFDNRKCLINVITDITELKKFEKEIFRLDRLELIGEMAASIGHEVRNPMTTVRGFLQILGAKEDSLQYKEYYDLMIGELDRANSIISEFLSLAKTKAIEYELKDINVIIKTLLPLLQADATKDDKIINIELSNTQDLYLNEKEIRQLILNLVRNGLEAMSQKGNVTISTFMDNGAVVLSVQDQGKGIKADVLEKLGTPFFTTKENGTGLGLAVCYSIAARHNAKIEIETNTRGTTFSVCFNQSNKTLVKSEKFAS